MSQAIRLVTATSQLASRNRRQTAGSIPPKMDSDNLINCVEGLIRLLKIRHDLITPAVGLSPYKMVFGRKRPLGGLPTEIDTRCPAADAFMNHMANEELGMQENKNRHRSLEFQTSDWVWILRPTEISGPKL